MPPWNAKRRKPQRFVRWKLFLKPDSYGTVYRRADPVHPTDRVYFDKKGVEQYRLRLRRTSWYDDIWRVYREMLTVTCPIYDPTIYGLGDLVDNGWRVERAEQRGVKVVYTLYRDIVTRNYESKPNQESGWYKES